MATSTSNNSITGKNMNGTTGKSQNEELSPEDVIPAIRKINKELAKMHKSKNRQTVFGVCTIILFVFVAAGAAYFAQNEHLRGMKTILDWFPAILTAMVGIMLFLCMNKLRNWENEMAEYREKMEKTVNRYREQLDHKIESKVGDMKADLQKRVEEQLQKGK